jgi:hypothetical protein
MSAGEHIKDTQKGIIMKKFNVIINNYMDTDHGTITINSTMIAEGISEKDAFNMLQVIKSDFDHRRPENTKLYYTDEAASGSGNLYFVSRDWVKYNCHFNEVATMHEVR